MDWRIKSNNLKLKPLEENIEENLHAMSWLQFLGEETKIMGNKCKTGQVGLHQTENLLHRNKQLSTTATYGVWENSYQPYFW